ncbi:T9SS type A sorting domain-containing protein [Bacteroidota bacterium]
MKKIIFLLILTIISVSNLYAQTNYGTYSFQYNSCGNPDDSVVTPPSYGTFSKFQRAVVICDNALTGTWNTQNWSEASTQDTNQYCYFSFTLIPPNTFNISTIQLSFISERSQQGPGSACVMYRFGSDAFQLLGSGWTPTTTATPYTEIIPAPPDINQTYLEIRFYGWLSSKGHWMNFDDVSLSGETPLPVELTSFTSTVNDRNVRLNWSTAVEVNNAGFEIERRIINDGSQWTKIGFVEGNGTTNEPKNYSFTDTKLNTGKYNYRLKQIDYNNVSTFFNLSNTIEISVPKKSELSQNYPNPFNPVTKIDYNLPIESKVSLKIYDISGRDIVTLVNETQTAGYYTVQFDASKFASGIYIYQITTDDGQNNFEMTKRMILVK